MLNPKKVFGIEYFISIDDEVTLNYSLLTLEKGIVKYKEKNEKELKQLDKNIPIAISICGKGILTKTLEHSNQVPKEIFPNIKLDDFYLQKEDEILCIARKDVIHEVIAAVVNEGFNVISVNLNGLAVKSVLPFIGKNISTIQLSNFSYEIENENLNSFSKQTASTSYSIGDELIESKNLISYATAFQELLPNYETHSLQEEQFRNYKEEFKQKKIFKVAGITSLMFVFLILLVNFFIFNQLHEQFNANTSELNVYESQLTKLKSIKEEVQTKEGFMKQSGWYNPSKVSYYADRIGSTIPNTIILTSFEINPFDKKESKKLKEIKFTNDLIIIEGWTQNSFEINKWINIIKEFEWVEEALVSNYIDNPENSKAKFVIEIMMKK